MSVLKAILLWVIAIFVFVSVFVDLLDFIFPQEEKIEIDYSSRFDRLELGIQNSAVDVCSRWGGKWVIDGNELQEIELDLPARDGLFVKGLAALCVKKLPQLPQ